MPGLSVASVIRGAVAITPEPTGVATPAICATLTDWLAASAAPAWNGEPSVVLIVPSAVLPVVCNAEVEAPVGSEIVPAMLFMLLVAPVSCAAKVPAFVTAPLTTHGLVPWLTVPITLVVSAASVDCVANVPALVTAPDGSVAIDTGTATPPETPCTPSTQVEDAPAAAKQLLPVASITFTLGACTPAPMSFDASVTPVPGVRMIALSAAKAEHANPNQNPNAARYLIGWLLRIGCCTLA